ncbi:MAG: methyltransferase domain-containing protein [Candidatus Omnitrophica bacterium]|nr:methyltransferase domain-containing protein [Candidatus Omnitrophota bacterium]
MKVLVCPLHRGAELTYSQEKKYFSCVACKRKFEIKEFAGQEIADFLIDKKEVNKGFRGIEGRLLRIAQSAPFKRQIETGKSVLDIGCGDNPRGNINMDCYIPDRIPQNFVLADAEYPPLKERSVDIVLSNYVLEHTLDPAGFIRNACSIAKEKVEIITDNSEWIGDIFFRLWGAGRIFHEEHYYKWSREYLRNLLKKLKLADHRVYLANLSTNPLVNLFSVLGKVPRAGNFFYRDLIADIRIN